MTSSYRIMVVHHGHGVVVVTVTWERHDLYVITHPKLVEIQHGIKTADIRVA